MDGRQAGGEVVTRSGISCRIDSGSTPEGFDLESGVVVVKIIFVPGKIVNIVIK